MIATLAFMLRSNTDTLVASFGGVHRTCCRPPGHSRNAVSMANVGRVVGRVFRILERGISRCEDRVER